MALCVDVYMNICCTFFLSLNLQYLMLTPKLMTNKFTEHFPSLLRLSLLPRAQSAVNKIRGILSEFGYKVT